MTYTIENEYIYASVKSEGAELTSFIYKEQKRELLWHGNPKFWGRHAPILFPFVGKLKNGIVKHNGKEINMGQHGFARDCNFDMLLQTKDEITFQLKSTEETKEKFPFDFCLQVNYKIEGKSLKTSYVVSNDGHEDLLYSIGGHPAYNVPHEDLNLEDYQLKFAKNENASIELLTDNGLLSGKQGTFLENSNIIELSDKIFENDALVFKSLDSDSLVIQSEKDKLALEISWANFPHLGIWKPIGAPFLCIEPWHGMADSENASGELSEKFGIICLEQKEKITHSYTASILPN